MGARFRDLVSKLKIREALPAPKPGDLAFSSAQNSLMARCADYMPKLEELGFTGREIDEI